VGREKHTVSLNRAISSFSDIEEGWPSCHVREVEVQAVCFSQWIEVGGVEAEDIICAKWPYGSHFDIEAENHGRSRMMVRLDS
jgi:hypothetical protein